MKHFLVELNTLSGYTLITDRETGAFTSVVLNDFNDEWQGFELEGKEYDLNVYDIEENKSYEASIYDVVAFSTEFDKSHTVTLVLV